MKSYIEIIVLLLFILLGSSCNGQSLKDHVQRTYEENRRNFDSALVSHFPNRLLSDSTVTIRNEKVSYNNVSFFLYNYDISQSKLDSIEQTFSRINFRSKYTATDTCLLIVNRFALKEEDGEDDDDSYPIISDSSLIERGCYKNLFPVPNFIDYNGPSSTACGLDNTFTIYVLEARGGKYSEKYDVKPFAQMPKKWSNGYSKGIAISRINHTVIYWSILW